MPKKETAVESTSTPGPSVAITRVQKKMLPVIEQAKSLVIKNNEQYVVAGEHRQAIKGLLKEIDELMDPIVSAAYQSHKVAVQQKKSVAQPLEEADRHLMGARQVWGDQQERIRQAEQRRLQEEAERLNREALAKEQEKLMQEATRLAEQGKTQEAMELMEVEPEVEEVQAVQVQSSIPVQQGMSQRVTWSAEVVDLVELVKAVASGRVPLQCLQADQVFLNKQAQAFRGALEIPGVKAKAKQSESVRV